MHKFTAKKNIYKLLKQQMNYRDGIRRRPIDDQKSLFIIKDLSKAKLTSNKEGQAELINMEKELYKVMDHYDKRKKTEVPK